MKDAEDIAICLTVCLIVMIFSILATYMITMSGWEQDCQQLGKHRVGQDVYECRKAAK